MKAHRNWREWLIQVATAVVVGVGALVSPVAAQSSPPQTDAYLRQLASVVDGYSGGGPIWVVMCGDTSPYEVIGVYTTAGQANEAAAAARADAKTCWSDGPYRSARTFEGGRVTFGALCKKGPDSQCIRDSLSTVTPMANVAMVTVTMRYGNGRIAVDSFRPETVEAIFFTMSAVDKMLIPYYQGVYGPGFAAMQRAILARRAQVAVSR